MTTNFYLDKRGVGSDATMPIKISISSKRHTVYLPTNVSVLPEQWDKRSCKIVAHPQKARLNTLLTKRKLDVDTALYELQMSGRLHGLSAAEIKAVLLSTMDPSADDSLVLPRLESYAQRQGKYKTKSLYDGTAKKVAAFAGPRASTLHFDDINARWLEQFDEWMGGNGVPKKNARNVYLRCLRAVFNEAIDDGITDAYPFRKFKIRPEPTKSRALTVQQLRDIFGADMGPQQHYIDIFRLSFCLGGLSFCDLINLKKGDVVNGRIEFRRQKTGQFVSIAVLPEAQALIDKYAGKTYLIYIRERYADTDGYLARMRAQLRHVGLCYDESKKKWLGSAIAPSASQYWARYSFATIAAELGFGEDAIAAVLGHHSNSVTQIYIRANRNRQVDEVVRAVIDTVFRHG